jgi:hypothetical protein
MKWLKSVFSNEGDASSKRVASIIALLVCINLSYIGTFTDYKCPEYMYDGLLILAGSGLGLTVIESIFDKKKSNDKSNEGTN